MATVIELAKEAIINRNYLLAIEIFEQGFNDLRRINKDYYMLYAETLCRVGRIKDAIDVYTHLSTVMNYPVTVDQLKYLTLSLLENILKSSCGGSNTVVSNNSILQYHHHHQQSHSTSNLTSSSSSSTILSPPPSSKAQYDPLLCTACHDIIIQPVTAICGHTFCRTCLRDRVQCTECAVKFSNGNNNCEQDILVKKLTEKWWPGEIKSSQLNEEALGYLKDNSFDDALRCCNESLEKG